jgi:hypothetical protein
MGLFTVWAAAKRFRRASLYLFRMLRVVFGNGHGCYKHCYDAVKLAGIAPTSVSSTLAISFVLGRKRFIGEQVDGTQ